MAGGENYVPTSWAEVDNAWSELRRRTVGPGDVRADAPAPALDAGQGLAAYLGQNGMRNESVRLGSLADVHALDGYDNAGRSALKEA